jgi:hypothetical protein
MGDPINGIVEHSGEDTCKFGTWLSPQSRCTFYCPPPLFARYGDWEYGAYTPQYYAEYVCSGFGYTYHEDCAMKGCNFTVEEKLLRVCQDDKRHSIHRLSLAVLLQ